MSTETTGLPLLRATVMVVKLMGSMELMFDEQDLDSNVYRNKITLLVDTTMDELINKTPLYRDLYNMLLKVLKTASNELECARMDKGINVDEVKFSEIEKEIQATTAHIEEVFQDRLEPVMITLEPENSSSSDYEFFMGMKRKRGFSSISSSSGTQEFGSDYSYSWDSEDESYRGNERPRGYSSRSCSSSSEEYDSSSSVENYY